MDSAESREKRRKMRMQREKQARANTPAWLAGLLVIAVVSFFVLGDVIAHRDAHATEWAGLARASTSSGEVSSGGGATRPDSAASPLAMLADGIVEDATAAADALSRGDATAAAVAMDGAMRAAEVGRDAAAGSSRAAFAGALAAIRRARKARQNGDAAGAAAVLRRVGDPVADVESAAPAAPSDFDGYAGARLLNARGATIGVVDHVSSGAGSASTATLVVGGYHQVLGFLDFGGARVTVPRARLAFGAAKTLGPTLVVLGTMAGSPADVQRALGSAGGG